MEQSQDGEYLKCLKGFVHYGAAADDKPPAGELKPVKKLRALVRYDEKHQPVYEFLFDIMCKKRWAKSVAGGPFTSEGKDKRHRRFNGVKAADSSELRCLNEGKVFAEMLGGESRAALSELDYRGGGEVLF